MSDSESKSVVGLSIIAFVIAIVALVFALLSAVPVSIGDLDGVSVLHPISGQVLTYNSGSWINANSSGGGSSTLADLSDVSLTSLADGEFLKYSSGSATWINVYLQASDIASGTFGTDRLDLNGLSQNIAFTGTQTVDGVDVSALLLKTTKVSDLATIWDKTTKIAYGDTSFANQNLLTTSTPSFYSGYLDSASTGSLTYLILKNNGVNKWGIYCDSSGGAYAGAYDFVIRDISSSTVPVTLNHNGQFALTVQGSSGGLVIGGDTNIYRFMTNILRTDDSFWIGGSYNNVRIIPSDDNNPTYSAFAIDNSAATYTWLYISKHGVINFGDGAGNIDTSLYRSAANTLKTDDSFIAYLFQPTLNYYSVDGSAGSTVTITFLKDSMNYGHMYFKNGLLVGSD